MSLDRGIVNSFGAYQTYYETSLLKSSTSSAISWIGTVQAFLLILTGVLSGPLYDRGYIRSLTIAGTVLLFFGMMMTSLISRYWEAFLAQGVVTGLGLGCLYVPGVAIVATYFSTKRAIAVGLASSGGSLGSSSFFFPAWEHDFGVFCKLTGLHRWCDISYHVSSSPVGHWLWLGYSDYRLRCSGHAAHKLGHLESKNFAKQTSSSFGARSI